jgi:predicted Zn-dependent protease
MWRRTVAVLMAAVSVWGCSGAVHQLPPVDSANLGLAQREVQSASGVPQRRVVDDEEALLTMRTSLARIRPAATQLCREMNVGVCTWRFAALKDRSLNAGAGRGGVIFINRGVVEYANSEEEVALVLAHEIGHQAANHIAAGERN